MSLSVKRSRFHLESEEFSITTSSTQIYWKRNSVSGRAMVKSKRLKTSRARGCGRAGGHCNSRFERRSASFSCTVGINDPKRRRFPMLADVDKSWGRLTGKAVSDRYGGGQGDHPRRRFRANSLSSLTRSRPRRLQSFVPGGSSSDPLNLQAEDLPDAPAVPLPDPKRFDKPANNFIPTNQLDPLGLMQSVDSKTPICQMYKPVTTKRKRVRSKKKDQTVVVTTVGDSVTSQSVPVNSSFSSSSATSNLALAVTASDATSGESDITLQLDGKKSERDIPVKMEATSCASGITLKSEYVDVSKPCLATVSNTVSNAGSSSLVPSDSKPKSSNVSRIVGSGHLKSNASIVDHSNSCTQNELENAIRLAQMRTNLYPVMASPLYEAERAEIPKDRKSLLQALRIEPCGQEERARLIKEQEKKDRDFKRMWRYPNLKSPAEEEQSSKTTKDSAMETLKIDTCLAEVTQDKSRKRFDLRGPPSRNVDSIVSPILRPDPSQSRKRRRTVSDCIVASTGAAKALDFHQSSSLDVSVPTNIGTPSPKKRRVSSGSGSGKFKVKIDQQQLNPPVKFSKNPVFKYGNYYRYYGYRTPEMEPDLRLRHFKLEWFEGKDVLDIGCNAGHVTLAVAQLFHPQKIVGIDIDPNLIRVARQNIKSYQTLANRNEMKKYPVSMTEFGPIEPLPALTNPSNYFPKNIMFMQGNYVLERDEQLNYVKEEYDTILALSITKWIHLNNGDDGLKRAFARMFQQLRPGGRLILEPQAWVSYRRRKKLTETIYRNYNEIQLKPEKFNEYLLNQVGFCKCEVIGVPFNPSKGFQRPLLLFTKFSDQSFCSPCDNSTAQLSRPPPSHSITERIANLAGYTSTPDDTPGVGTPVLQLTLFGQGEATPTCCSTVCSSSSLCSTCMSRASTGPHDSDFDYPSCSENASAGFEYGSSPPSESIPQENGISSPCEQNSLCDPLGSVEEMEGIDQGPVEYPVYDEHSLVKRQDSVHEQNLFEQSSELGEVSLGIEPFTSSQGEENEQMCQEMDSDRFHQDGSSGGYCPLYEQEDIQNDPELNTNLSSPQVEDLLQQDLTDVHPLSVKSHRNSSPRYSPEFSQVNQDCSQECLIQVYSDNSLELMSQEDSQQSVQLSSSRQLEQDNLPEQSFPDSSA